jgi:voltage-gated potassium channel
MTTDASQTSELKGTTYELFIGALSVLSIFNLILLIVVPGTDLAEVALIIDLFLSLIFLADFTMRLGTAESRTGYFFRQWGFIDLVSSLPLPQLKILRLTRIFRAGRLMRKYGAKAMITEFIGNRAQSALLILVFLIILVLEFGGWLMFRIEAPAGGNIQSPSDAVWYTFVTITTVGYGDRFPITNAGRIVGMVIMIAGVGLFGTLTGYLANTFLAPPKKKSSAAAVETPVAPEQAAVADLQRLLTESRAAQEALEAKVTELSGILETRPIEPTT